MAGEVSVCGNLSTQIGGLLPRPISFQQEQVRTGTADAPIPASGAVDTRWTQPAPASIGSDSHSTLTHANAKTPQENSTIADHRQALTPFDLLRHSNRDSVEIRGRLCLRLSPRSSVGQSESQNSRRNLSALRRGGHAVDTEATSIDSNRLPTTDNDPRLMMVINAWKSLPTALIEGIVAIVKAAKN